MIYQNIDLNMIYSGLGIAGEGAVLQTYVIENSPEMFMDKARPSIIICPGGGYSFTSDREAEPVALKWASLGYNVFVLRYSVAPKKYPQQLLEVSAAVAYVRTKANEWHLDEDRIFVCGFSAGGHLAGNLGVAWQEAFIHETLDIECGMNKPNGLILCYPVISTDYCAHADSFKNLIGEEADEVLRDKVCLEKRVTKDTPPTFLWHTVEDPVVRIENSMVFAMALRAAGIPFELHIYPDGCHGLSLATEETNAGYNDKLIRPHVASWFTLATEWMQELEV